MFSVAMRTVCLPVFLLLVTGPAVAFAAQPKAGGLYKGSELGCTAQPGYTCLFLFRVSTNGQSMTFVAKHNVPGLWERKGGGGEAILGPYKSRYKGKLYRR